MPHNRDNPFPAKLKSRTRLTGPQSDKVVQHLVFDIGGSGMAYKCGDSIAVLPKNRTMEVAEVLDILRIQPETVVEVPFAKKEMSIFNALHEYFSMENLSRHFWEWFHVFMTDSDEISVVEGEILCDDEECRRVAKAYSLLGILRKFRNLRRISAGELVTKLQRLTPRLYSVASSSLLHPDEVHIVVNVIGYVDVLGNARHGTASSYLGTDMEVGTDVANVFVVNSLFGLPTDGAANVIMVGPGTGIAPFRGFLQERQCLKAKGEKIGDSWLFFGDRHYASDFLFKDEILNFKDAGILTNLHLAFSRDQEKKIYVQDRIWENREELWSWILDGAHIYVCGNASSMAVDVDNTLRRIAVEVGHFDEVRTDDFFKSLKKTRHYQRDVY